MSLLRSTNWNKCIFSLIYYLFCWADPPPFRMFMLISCSQDLLSAPLEKSEHKQHTQILNVRSTKLPVLCHHIFSVNTPLNLLSRTGHVLSCFYPLEAAFILSTKRKFCILTATLVLSCDNNLICLQWGIFKYSAAPLIHPEGERFLQCVTGWWEVQEQIRVTAAPATQRKDVFMTE